MDEDDEPPMFSDAEIQRRMERYAKVGRTIDAGFTSRILRGLPRGVPREELFMSRAAFFLGAEWAMTMVHRIADNEEWDNTQKTRFLLRYMAETKKELTAFQLAKGSPPEPDLEPESAQKSAKVRKSAQ